MGAGGVMCKATSLTRLNTDQYELKKPFGRGSEASSRNQDSLVALYCFEYIFVAIENILVMNVVSNIFSLILFVCIKGLAELASRKYKPAAKCFLQASFDHCDCPEVNQYAVIAL